MNSLLGFEHQAADSDTALLQHGLGSPVVKTRLRPPVDSSRFLPRARLEHQLLGLSFHRLVLLCAPAGFGKTALLSALYRQLCDQGQQPLWLSLHSSDNHLPQFMGSLTGALLPLTAQSPVSLPELLARDTSPQLQTTMAYLLNTLADLGHPVFLLLDDLQLLQNPDVLARLQYLLDHAPDNLHLGVAGRCTTGLALTPLRYRGQLLELDAGDLAFTSAEIRDYLALTTHRDMPDDALRHIAELTEGWATGLQMLATSARFQQAPTAVLEELREGNRLVSRYFDEMVLAQLPPDILDFLLQISLLDELTPALCNTVTQREDAEAVLRWLTERNLFITLLDEQQPCYRLHQLFADTLRARLRRSHGHDIRQLHARASHYLAQQGQWRQAITHALHTGPGSLMVQDLPGLEHGAHALAEQGDIDILLRWLERLPEEIHAHSLRLQVTLAWALAHHFRFDECQRLLTRAGRLLQAGQGDAALAAEIQAVAAVCAVLADDPARAEALLAPLLPTLTELPAWIAGLVCNGLSSSYLAQGRHAEVLAIQRQQPLGDEHDNLLVSLYRASILGQVYLRQADLHTAGRFFQDALRRAENLAGARSNGAIALRAQLAELWHERRQWTELSQQIEPYLPSIQRSATLDGVLKAYRSLIRGYQQHAPGQAEQLIEQGLQLAQQRQWPRFSAGMLSEAIHLKRGQGLDEEAEALLQQLAQLRDAGQLAGAGQREVAELVSMHRVRLAMHQGRYQEACQQLAGLLPALRQRGRLLAWLQLETLRLCCEWRLGRHGPAVAGLLPLLQRGARQQLRQSFVESSPVLPELLQAASTGRRMDSQLMAYIEELQNYFPPQADAPAAPGAPLLSEREQEILAMVATGAANKVIARALAISAETVKWHLKNIFQKLAVANRMEALIRARELGLIPDQLSPYSVMPPSTKNSAPVAKRA